MKQGKIRGADVVYSADDGGWYASLFEQATRDDLPLNVKGGDSPVVASREMAEAWARKRGATVLLYP